MSQQIQYIESIKFKLSELKPNEVGYFLNNEINELIAQNQSLIFCFLTVLSQPDYKQFAKGVHYEESFDILLSNYQIKQVSKLYQDFLKNQINPSDRIMSKIIEQLSRDQEDLEIERLLAHAQDTNLMEIYKPLFIQNNLSLIRKTLVKLPLDQYRSITIWTELIDKQLQKQIQVQELKQAVLQIANENISKQPEVIDQIMNQLIEKSVLYRIDANNLFSLLNLVVLFRVQLQNNLTKALIYMIDLNTDFRLILKLVRLFKYCLQASTYQQALQLFIQNGNKFELFCLIELILTEEGFNFTFDDLLLSQKELKYIIVQQSYFHRFLNRIQNEQSAEQKDQEKKVEKDFMLECISLASEPSEISDIDFI